MSLVMQNAEIKTLDAQVEGMMDWANSRRYEAEQLALDSARLLSCTGDRIDHLSKQGFFKRCWSRFSGKTGEMERSNTNDLIHMQKISLRYINMLQEQQLMMAHSILSLKNNLLSLAVKEEETRNIVALLAQRTLERFEQLESRVDQIEISTNLQGWLLGLEEREYDEKIPTENMRLFQVINDFYAIKNDAWNYNDLMFMRKAIRTVGLNPKKKLSINIFIDSLTDEILQDGIGIEKYQDAITRFCPTGIEHYSTFVIENISSPVFTTLHGLKVQYTDRLDVVETLSDEMNISAPDALKRLLRKSIANLNINLDYEFPLAETAVEILGCLRLATRLAEQTEAEEVIAPQGEVAAIEVTSQDQPKKNDITKLMMGPWRDCVTPSIELEGYVVREGILEIVFFNDKWMLFTATEYYYSSDLVTWEREVIKDMEHIYDIKGYKIYDKLFIITNDCVMMTIDGNIWNILPVPKEYNRERVRYKKIFSNGTDYFLYGEYSRSYIRSGFLSDKTFNSSSSIFLRSNDMNNWQTYDFYDDFYRYTIHDIVYNNDKFIANVCHIDESENLLLISNDGLQWDKIKVSDSITGRMLFFNKFFIDIYRENHVYASEDGFRWKIEKVVQPTARPFSWGDIRYYNELGVIFNLNNEGLFISNDFLTWQQIDLPSHKIGAYSSNRRYAYNGRQLLISGGAIALVRDIVNNI
jgi:hypothetical protein